MPVGDGREAVVDIGGQDVGVEPVEGCLARRSWPGPRAAMRTPPAAAGPRRPADCPRDRRQGRLAGVDDRLEAVQRRERARSGLLGQEQGGPSARNGRTRPAGSSPRWSTTARTSAAKPYQPKSSPGGRSDSPWARSSKAMHRKRRPRSAASGASTAPQKPVAWARSRSRSRSPEVVVGDAHTVGRLTRPVGARLGQSRSSAARPSTLPVPSLGHASGTRSRPQGGATRKDGCRVSSTTGATWPCCS